MNFTNVHVTNYEEALGADGQLVDVRERDEIAAGTIPDAINIPLGELPDRKTELDPAQPVVLFCRSGGRSAQAAEYLSRCGFSSVINLEGGMLSFTGRTVTQ